MVLVVIEDSFHKHMALAMRISKKFAKSKCMCVTQLSTPNQIVSARASVIRDAIKITERVQQTLRGMKAVHYIAFPKTSIECCCGDRLGSMPRTVIDLFPSIKLKIVVFSF